MSQPPDDDAPKPQSRPSLIPADVWESYQSQVSGTEAVHTGDHTLPLVAVVNPDDPEMVTAELQVGLGSSAPVDTSQAEAWLSKVPLFAGIRAASLNALARAGRVGRLSAGQYLFVQGADADTFYLVVAGTLDAFRKKDEVEQPLRRVGGGELVGLFGVFSGRIRAASARVTSDATVLEIPCTTIDELLDSDPELHHRVVAFFRDKLIESFIANSPLFVEVEPNARAEVTRRFSERLYASQETVVAPGEVANLLLLVMNGKLRVEQKPRPGTTEPPAPTDVQPGDFLAVTGAMHGAPCPVRVFAEGPTSVVGLGIRELAELGKEYPELRQLTQRLTITAKQLERFVFYGHGGTQEA